MSTTIVMPKAGLTMVEGTISRWLVTEGAHVKKGDALMEYENEKNTIECDALADGYVHILAQEGDTIPVGEPIGILAESQEELASLSGAAAAPAKAPCRPCGPRSGGRVCQKRGGDPHAPGRLDHGGGHHRPVESQRGR